MARGPVLTVTLTSDAKGVKKGVQEAEGYFSGFGNKLSGFGVAVGTAAGNLAAQAIPKIIDFGTELFTLGTELETMSNKANTVFGDSVGEVRTWADEVNESLGLSDETVIGLAASMGDLLVPMGFTREAAADLTTETLDAAGALSAWSGGQYDTAQVADILTKAMLGERDSLKALGISINQAEVDQRALAIATADGRTEVTEMDKALATQQLVLEKSTDAQTAWKDGTMDAVKQQNELKAALEDAKASLAQGLLPIVQNVVAFIAETMIPKIKELIAEFQENWPKIQEAVEPVLNWFVETATDVWTVISELWDTYGAMILEYTESAFKAIKQIIEGVLKVIKGIIDVVLGVLTGDWDKAWNGLKNIVSGVWDAIKGVVNLAIANVKLQLSAAWATIKEVAGRAWEGIKQGIKNALDSLVDEVTKLPGRILQMHRALLEAGLSLGKAVINGLKDGLSAVAGFAGDVGSAVLRAVKNVLNTHVIDKINRALEFKISLPFGAGSFNVNPPDIPRLAQGGIVKARPGGILANIGEGRYDEAVIPLKRGMDALGGNTYNTYINVPTGMRPQDVVQAQRDYARRNGVAA